MLDSRTKKKQGSASTPRLRLRVTFSAKGTDRISHDVLQVVIAQGVAAPQVRLTWRTGKQGRPRPACQHGSPGHARSLDVCKT